MLGSPLRQLLSHKQGPVFVFYLTYLEIMLVLIHTITQNIANTGQYQQLKIVNK